ncbi:Alpha/beta hydrolase family protein [Aquisphaera giovannonii]|uniref:Alpha/beta hydrolase family protein n=1 Tax=Aquisphaera giovannonii TaxID=406548 RepID=A0A5B9W2V9_9BACT|nr:hypothetical protein [Aquisphaera giovannonii]QEH34963.1 Alpha/beta hydrolase family protein [Aquisphaera giovannonii]
MTRRREPSRRFSPCFDPCEARTLPTPIFVLNGSSFNAAGPSDLTANAAAVLRRAGNRVVQLSYGRIDSAAAFDGLARRVAALAHGRPVGLVGFSAGGALALRLAAAPGIRAVAVLDYYGVPDVRAYLSRHARDRVFRPISGLAPYRPGVVSRLSGALETPAHVVAAFGRSDPNVRADASSADLLRDSPGANVYTYAGGHGVGIGASRPALEDFLAHLGEGPVGA